MAPGPAAAHPAMPVLSHPQPSPPHSMAMSATSASNDSLDHILDMSDAGTDEMAGQDPDDDFEDEEEEEEEENDEEDDDDDDDDSDDNEYDADSDDPEYIYDSGHARRETEGLNDDDRDALVGNEQAAAETPTPEHPTAEQGAVQLKKLTLLELPVDILRMIVQEVSHVSDLTSLARTNSTLHTLAIPLVYARFDIVWPESQGTSEDSKSVDALTFGLSTLCLGSSFAYRTQQLRQRLVPPSTVRQGYSVARLRRSDYAKFTRKFALGNGPEDLVSDYLIWREAGKMLGTLVALAIQRMVNLETFFWDMPTGVLSDVFLALSSLQDHSPDGSCKLQNVWVRWHHTADFHGRPSSSEQSANPVNLGTLTPIGYLLPSNGAITTGGHDNQATTTTTSGSNPTYQQSRVEYPNFSVLPPLKVLTVLDIDELEYLDEMAILIARSQPMLRELRVGISARAINSPFVQTWDGAELQQVDRNALWPGEGSVGDHRLGGVLGILVGHMFDLRGKEGTPEDDEKQSEEQGNLLHARLDKKLELHTLELERIPLSVQVCSRALDWSTLTNLTLLQCPHSDLLWKALRRQFAPASPRTASGRKAASHSMYQYQLALKKVHTDVPSATLMSFLKEALAPNTLEVLFLQDRRPVMQQPVSLVPVESIFRGPIKRHRASLKKILLDSSDTRRASGSDSQRWRNWIPTTEMLLWMTSGRMSNLRELATYVNYKDWHTFLQRLPNMPQLRSLNIPAIADHAVEKAEPKELALQFVDIVSLRPEMQLCYVGIHKKCFEIMETRERDGRYQDSAARPPSNQEPNGASNNGTTPTGNGLGIPDANDDGNNDDDENGDDIDEEEDDGGSGDTPSIDGDVDGNDTQSEASDNNSTFSDSEGQYAGTPRFGLREILFYDYKVEIFKARHGRL